MEVQEGEKARQKEGVKKIVKREDRVASSLGSAKVKRRSIRERRGKGRERERRLVHLSSRARDRRVM